MRELPSHGRCHSAFLLAFSASLRTMPSVEAWIASAASRASYMASAGDIVGTAAILLDGGLATADGEIALGPQLAGLTQQADRVTLVGIAALLLKRFPPGWIVTAVVGGQVVPELIPSFDRDRLAWLGSDLIPLILEVHRSLTTRTDDQLRKLIGDAGELAIMSALVRAGHDPIHVALFSDAYGYDIEYAAGPLVKRLEVKTVVQTTADRVLVSRNEFDKAREYGESWRLVQVVFSSAIFVTRTATSGDIQMIREMSGSELHALAPEPRPQFRWSEAAEFRPSATSWADSALVVPSDFSISIAVPLD